MGKTKLIDGKYMMPNQTLMVPITQKRFYVSLQHTPTSYFGSSNTAFQQLLMNENELSKKPESVGVKLSETSNLCGSAPQKYPNSQ